MAEIVALELAKDDSIRAQEAGGTHFASSGPSGGAEGLGVLSFACSPN